MTVDHYRPSTPARRFALLTIWLLLGLYGCAGADLTTPASPERAAAFAARGEHAAAAREYDAVASTAVGALGDPFRLAAAREWLLAGQPKLAAAALQRLAGPLDGSAMTERDRLRAQLALAESDPALAWQIIGTMPAPQDPTQRERHFELRQRIALANRLPLEAVRSATERERVTSDAAAVAALRLELLAALRAAVDAGVVIDPRTAARDTLARGWLEAASLAARTARAPAAANPSLTASWQRRYPNHPARAALSATHAESLTTAAATQDMQPQRPTLAGAALPATSAAGARTGAPLHATREGHVAALLPLSGNFANQGNAVREGLIAAYRNTPPAGDGSSGDGMLPLRFYDTAAQAAIELAGQAIANGATFIIGPLTRDDVSQLATSGVAANIPVLALNTLPVTAVNASQPWLQFALSPEDEARAAARAALAAERRRAILLLPEGSWGERVGTAFSEALVAGGGTIVSSHTLTQDVGTTIETALRLDQSRARHRRLQSILDLPLAFQPRRRADVDLLFAPGTATHLRELRPRLKFHGASDLPTYTTADAWDGRRSIDLDGILFPDMPWMLQPATGSTASLQELLASIDGDAHGKERLFAFGHDAQLLQRAISRALTAGQSVQQIEVDGVTGKLAIDDRGHVQRELVQASIRDGIATAQP